MATSLASNRQWRRHRLAGAARSARTGDIAGIRRIIRKGFFRRRRSKVFRIMTGRATSARDAPGA